MRSPRPRRRPLAVACLVAACYAAGSCSDTASSGGPAFKDASVLAGDLEAMDRAVATAPLRSLAALALPINHIGLDVHNISGTELGQTLEWSAVRGEEAFTTRAGTPATALRVMLYTIDSTSRPAYPTTEIGYADLYPFNTYNGGGPDSISLRFVVSDTRGGTPVVVADFTAHHHADSACVQCATLDGWAKDGATRVDFHVPYHIPLNADGRFPGTFTSPALSVVHFATLPGPGSSAASANLTLAFAGDSIAITSGLLRPHAGQLDGSSNITIGGVQLAAVTRQGATTTASGPGGNLSGVQLRTAAALFAVPASIAYYIEWPTFVIFFCGC